MLKLLKGKALPAGAVREGFAPQVCLHRVLKREWAIVEKQPREEGTPLMGGNEPDQKDELQKAFGRVSGTPGYSEVGWGTGGRPVKGFKPRSVAETQKYINIEANSK